MAMSHSKRRNINGILLLDKPKGITSNAALQIVKKMFNAHKAGHTGSLDPLASGMLPICFGEATKFSRFLLEADKEYLISAKFGITTTTGDAEGEIIAKKSCTGISREKIERILPKFRGEIKQIPSMYSALKYHGRPLYELARQGIQIEREPRDVTIHEIRIIDCRDEICDFFVHCSKGTYIRTLIQDLGDALSFGGHVIELRRLRVGHYQDQMITLSELESLKALGMEALDNALLPIETTVANWCKLDVSEAAAFYLKRGQAVILPHAPTAGNVQLYIHGKQFIGVGEILDDGRVAPLKIIQVH